MSVLVYRPGQLGDTIASLPALRVLRERHGNVLTLLTDSPRRGWISAWDVLQPTGLFAGVVFYDRFDPRSLVAAWRKLRGLAPKKAYYLAPAPRGRWQRRRDRFFFQGLCGVKDARGFDESAAAPGRTESERLEMIAGGRAASPFQPPIGAAQRARVDALWERAGLSDADCAIALAPGAKAPASRWPLERYRELAGRLLAECRGARLIVIGGQEEGEFGRRLFDEFGHRVVNWAARLSVWESAEALRRCRLFVGNNSGAMHLADLMGTRCVVVASARDIPGLWDPPGTGHRVLRRDVSCAGCRLHVCVEKRLACLTDIGVDEALSACRAILEEAACR